MKNTCDHNLKPITFGCSNHSYKSFDYSTIVNKEAIELERKKCVLTEINNLFRVFERKNKMNYY